VVVLEVAEHQHDQRLDNFLLGRLKGVPKTLIYRIIRKGEVRINGKRAKPDSRVETGDKVRVPPVRTAERGEAPKPGSQLAERLRAAILLDDPAFMVLNKPAGLAVHAGTGANLGVIEAMRQLYPEWPGLELVHRLDKGTSGCLLLAKTGKARKRLMDAFREHEVRKTYHAIVTGSWPARLKRVDAALLRQPERGGQRRKVAARVFLELVPELFDPGGSAHPCDDHKVVSRAVAPVTPVASGRCLAGGLSEVLEFFAWTPREVNRAMVMRSRVVSCL
jgi:23S rRNA pseudouridine955/2504/2580 synthase